MNGTVPVTTAYLVVSVQCWGPDDRANASTELAYWKGDLKSLGIPANLSATIGDVPARVEWNNDSSNVWFALDWVPSPEPGSH